MGMSTEQTVAVIEAVGEVVEKTSEPSTNYWWLLIIAVVPAIIGMLWKRKK